MFITLFSKYPKAIDNKHKMSVLKSLLGISKMPLRMDFKISK